MKKISLLALGLVLAMGSGAWAKPVHRKHPAPAVQRDPDSMQGRIGAGPELIQIPGGYAGALGGRYWATDKLAIDAAIGGGSVNTQAGTKINGQTLVDNSSNLLLSGGVRFDIAQPVQDLHVQLIGDLKYIGASAGNSYYSNSSSTVGLFAGAGLEAFIPGWNAVSVDIDAGLALQTSDAGGSWQDGVTLGGGANTLPFNLGLHYYFN